MVDGWWELIVPDPVNRPGAKPELYDLQNDPWEKVDLAEKDPARVGAMLKKIDAWWQR